MALRTTYYQRLIHFLALLLLGGVLAGMFPAATAWAIWWREQAAGTAFFLTLLGIACFVAGRAQATFVCLGYAAAISCWLVETGRGEETLDFQTLFFW
jgi:hypothetical protein